MSVSGHGWGFHTPGAWRIRNAERVLVGCYDKDAVLWVEKIVGRLIVRVMPQSSVFPIDPAVVFDDGNILEMFSSDTFEPWVWTFPTGPALVAAPGESKWVQEMIKGLRERERES